MKRKKLTDDQWRQVFQLRCRTKRGEHLSQDDLALVYAAFKEDPKRYEVMDGNVFDATVPFGSTVRWKKKGARAKKEAPLKIKKKTLAKRATTKKTGPVKKPTVPKPKIDPDRALAAAEVLQAVWLHEKHFDLESEIVLKDGRPVVHQDADEHLWVTVKLHVPMLDVDTWLDGTHLDHPDNQSDEDEEDA